MIGLMTWAVAIKRWENCHQCLQPSQLYLKVFQWKKRETLHFPRSLRVVSYLGSGNKFEHTRTPKYHFLNQKCTVPGHHLLEKMHESYVFNKGPWTMNTTMFNREMDCYKKAFLRTLCVCWNCHVSEVWLHHRRRTWTAKAASTVFIMVAWKIKSMHTATKTMHIRKCAWT